MRYDLHKAAYATLRFGTRRGYAELGVALYGPIEC